MDEEPSDRTTTGRLLAVLSLLEARPDWTGPLLAQRLGVTARTIRRDIDRLRNLGYPVVADTGARGGYHLGPGGRAMPPLMLDREEALAVAVCLRSAATESIAGGGDAAVRALGKLERLLPPPVRRQIGTIGSMTSRLGAGASPVDPDLLVTITRACRDAERLRVRYRDARGGETERVLEPYRVVSTARRWYLVARDPARQDWRTFRVDRLLSVEATGHRVTIVDPPDPAALVQAGITTAPYRHRARVVLDLPLRAATELVPPTVGMLEPLDDGRTMLTTGADDLGYLASHLLALDVAFTVVEPEELRTYLHHLRSRLDRAIVAGIALGGQGYDRGMSPSHQVVARATADTEAVMSPQSVPVNVYEAKEALIVVAPMPAVTADDVRVEVHPGDPPCMRFWAHVRSAGPRDYIVHEWEYGGYERQLDLPIGFGGGVEASLHNGQLVVRLLRGEVAGRLDVRPT